eukprot:CAMPEP_0115155358 /NCGR_PEP_ID=MMETSP0227-20121206/67841_1 /TAXON_ID=89957 /ORGANISM="Polarella glacialis, Strain CCMP 1383" /LENGTH=871 /DNA_ID=CAMNT_0002566407 /DNA_START=68 /DNA_END=2683 /DNA_ORIENTATION=+
MESHSKSASVGCAIDDCCPALYSDDVVVATGRGRDRPGLCESFVRVVVSCGCQVLDMAQFLLEGSLVFTFVFSMGNQDSMRVIMELLECAHATGLKLDFHFPSAASGADQRGQYSRSRAQSIGQRVDAGLAASAGSRMAVLNVVRNGPITASLLHDIDTVLEEFECTVIEIEHRSDNKIENNGELSKVSLRLTCPSDLLLSALYMGAPASNGGCASGFQRVAREHDAVMTVSWYDGINRPTGKSLVVFELSNVLCPFDVLDEVLRQAGIDPDSAPRAEGDWQQGRNKVAMLKGHSADVVRKVTENLGLKDLSDKLRQLLGIDYVICQNLQVTDGHFTGEYAGEASDVRFRKSDLLKLMAERESINFKNVIVVGSFLKGLKASDARLMLETFGPNVLFNSSQQRDLSLALYLLGFSGSHVRALRRTYEPGSQDCDVAEDLTDIVGPDLLPAKAGGSSFFITVNARGRQPGQTRRIFEPLATCRTLESPVRVCTVRQCGLQDGGMCLGLELENVGAESLQLLKDLLFACHRNGFQVNLDEQVKQPLSPKSPKSCWQHYFQNRHVVTVVQRPQISGECLCAVLRNLSEHGVNIVKIQRLSVHKLAALQITVNLPGDLEGSEDFSSQLLGLARTLGADIAFQKDDVDRWMRRLIVFEIVFDMDSTLIQQEVIDELAKIAGVGEEVKALTEAAMRGELNFYESLKARVQLLKGHHAEDLFRQVKQNLVFTPGAKKLCSTLKKLGYKMAVISGGFLPVAQEVQRELGLDYAFANTLEVDEKTGLLTGSTCGPVVTPQRKRALLAMIANVEGCEVQQTIAVGDGANDIPMLNTAGLGIAFCAKPKVQAATEFHINHQDLTSVLFLIGLSEHATERLAG